eukprot:8327109-Pyramimonas_sp.AAC.1
MRQGQGSRRPSLAGQARGLGAETPAHQLRLRLLQDGRRGGGPDQGRGYLRDDARGVQLGHGSGE